MSDLKVTTLCYIFRENQVLLLYRNAKKNDPNEGKWIGVGGKLETGETADQCVCREVQEETGLRLTSYRLLGQIDFISDRDPSERMMLYTADGFEGQEQACDEGRLEWIDRDRVLSLPMWEGDRMFLEPLLAGATAVNMRLIYHGDILAGAEDVRVEY